MAASPRWDRAPGAPLNGSPPEWPVASAGGGRRTPPRRAVLSLTLQGGADSMRAALVTRGTVASAGARESRPPMGGTMLGEVGETLELVGVLITILGSLGIMVALGKWWET